MYPPSSSSSSSPFRHDGNDSSNPFSNPRLFDTPNHVRTMGHMPLTTSERVALSPGSAPPVATSSSSHDTDAMLAALLDGRAGGHQNDLTRLSIGNTQTTATPVQAQQSHVHMNNSNLPADHESYYNLLKSAREGDLHGVQTLLTQHPSLDVNYVDRDGDSALHRAAAGGHLKLVHLLVLDHGADIHRQNHVGETPMFVNAKSQTGRNTELITFLAQCGADIHTPNAAGQTTLSIVADAATHQQQPSTSNPFASATTLHAGSHPNRSLTHPPLTALQESLLSTHNSPVRQFVLRQHGDLLNHKKLLAEAALESQSLHQLSSHSRDQASQLHAAHAALRNGLLKLQELDDELQRTHQKQIAAATAAAAAATGDSHAPAHPQVQTQVLIAEVRQALQSVAHAFR